MELSGKNFPGVGVFNVGIAFHVGISRGKKEFSMEGEPDSLELFKKGQKIKK